MSRNVTAGWMNGRMAMALIAIGGMVGVSLVVFHFQRDRTERDDTAVSIEDHARPTRLAAEKEELRRRRTRSALSPELLEVIRQTGRVERRYDTILLAENLREPGALAVHPVTGRIFVLEEGVRIVRLDESRRPETVLDETTPILEESGGAAVETYGLNQPGDLAFLPNGDLYVSEQATGGRLVLFLRDEDGDYPKGRVIHVPGAGPEMAWTGMDVSRDGRILLAGLDADRNEGAGHVRLHRSVMLYRDQGHDWWLPFQRVFADFSSVRFSKSGEEALYTCRQTGEVGWVDLNSRRTLLGSGSQFVASPSSVVAMPDGTLAALDESGRILHLDPADDRLDVLFEDLPAVAALRWDEQSRQLLASDRAAGRILAIVPDPAFDIERDRLQYAMYYPMYRVQNVPRECPEYLARILAWGGLDFLGPEEPPVTFREFVSRVPLIAADVRAISMDARADVPDPIRTVYFVVFEPNRMIWEEAADLSLTFGLFAAKTESGRLIKSTTRPIRLYGDDDDAEEGRVDIGMRPVAVPQPSAVSVSMRGIAAVQFLGMGHMADYALVLNTHDPDESYMMVYNHDGSLEQYRLQPHENNAAENWVVAYANQELARWDRLSGAPEEVLPIPLEDLPF